MFHKTFTDWLESCGLFMIFLEQLYAIVRSVAPEHYGPWGPLRLWFWEVLEFSSTHPPDASLDAQEESHHTSIATSLNMTIRLVFWRVFRRVYVPVVVLRVIMLDGWTNEVQFGFLPVTGAQRWVSLHGNFVSVCPSYKVSFPWIIAVKHDTTRLSRFKAR